MITKFKTLHIGAMAFCLALLTTTGCTETKEHYINLDETSVNFEAENNEPVIIKVTATAEFTVTPAESWIEVSNITKTSFTVNVQNYDQDFDRTGTVTLQSGTMGATLTVTQLAKENDFARFRSLFAFQDVRMSRSGRYVGCLAPAFMDDGVSGCQITIIDLETDEHIDMGTYPESLFLASGLGAMTDDGILFVHTDKGSQWGFDVHTKDSFRPASYPDLPGQGDGMARVSQASADGNIWIGYIVKGKNYPVKYTNREPELLPLPEKSFTGQELWGGVYARGCSADGSIIYGHTSENYDFGMVYWKDGKVEYAGGLDKETGEPIYKTWTEYLDAFDEYLYLANGLTIDDMPDLCSPSGEWIAAAYRTQELISPYGDKSETYYPAFFNTVKNETTVFKDKPGCTAICVTDDGIGFIGNSNLGPTGGWVVNIEKKTILGTFQEWVKNEYGINIPGGCINCLSSDKKIVFGSSPFGTSFRQWYVGPSLK